MVKTQLWGKGMIFAYIYMKEQFYLKNELKKGLKVWFSELL